MKEMKPATFKAVSIYGALILLLACFVTIASGIILITENMAVNGAFTIAAGVVCGVCSYFVYRNYQKKIIE